MIYYFKKGKNASETQKDLCSICLENSMDRGDWWATVRGVTELDTTSDQHIHTCK